MLPLKLRSPYPFTDNLGKALFSNFFVGIFVALFLIIFQPFNINLWESDFKLLKLAGFGLVSFLAPTLVTAAVMLAMKSGVRDRWTIAHEIISVLIVLAVIALGNLLYGHFLGIMKISLSGYLLAFAFTCGVGFFPVSVHVIRKQNRIQRQSSQKGLELSLGLEAPKELPQKGTRITFLAENNKDSHSLSSQDLLYLEAADNYCLIHYLENGQPKKVLLRGSLKRFEQQVRDQQIVRCHRAFIVNTARVRKVEGNAAGYKLQLDGSETMVPVSRNFIPVIDQLLARTRAAV